MIEMNDDVISHIGEFLSHKDLFLSSTVNKQWRKSLFFHKKKQLTQIYKDVNIAHLCDNLCPCLVEKYYQNMIAEFKLKRYMCAHLNHTPIPVWLAQYLE